jgi:hypothetical protein
MLTRSILILCAVACLSARAATLEQMSIEDLTRESTSIVRGSVGESRTAQVGPLIYTFTTLRIAENLKGEAVREIEIALPGGRIGDLSQRFGGVPQLEPGKEYLFFLWRGPSGLTQVTGLSQGLIEIKDAAGSDRFAVREPSPELLIAPGSGEAVKNGGLRMPLRELIARIRGLLSAGGQQAP